MIDGYVWFSDWFILERDCFSTPDISKIVICFWVIIVI